MIELYGMSSPNVRKVVIALEELGLAYRLHHVAVFRGRQFAPEFLRLNPLAKVPVIVDDDRAGEACPIFESGAILIYLAETYGGGFLDAAGPGRWEALKWLVVQVANIGPVFGQHSHFRGRAAESPYAARRFRQTAAQLYRVLDQRLGEVAFLAGDAYSIADMATYPWARYLRRHGMTPQEVPRLQAWMDAIAERPAVRRAAEVMAQAGRQDTADRQAATAEETDRFHWRHFPAPTAEAAARRLEGSVRRDPDIGGIDHVAVTVRDVEAMSRFYVELLGARIARDHLRDGRPAIRKLVLGDAVLNLHQCDNDVDLIAGRPTPGAADVCLRWGGSAEAAAARLTQAGVAIVEGPSARTNSAGQPSHSVYFRDPDGNLVELMALDFGAGRG